MPESLIFLTENSPGVSNDRFGFKKLFALWFAQIDAANYLRIDDTV